MENCRYSSLYNNLEKGEKFTHWTCEQNANSSDQFCCFHDDKQRTQWDKDKYQKFMDKVQYSIGSGNVDPKPLFCIGYHFPTNISFKLLLPLDPDPPSDKKGSLDEDGRDTRQRICNFPIYLCDAEFNGQVEFSHCTFKNILNLSGAIFNKEVLFRDTIFEDKFYPRTTKFSERVDFRKTEFLDADFHDTVFKGKANFRQSEFRNKEHRTRFLDVKFQDTVNFVNTKFWDETEFVGTSLNKAFFSRNVEFRSKIKFKYVVFENGDKILFVTEDLSKVSFMNTDITRVRFSDKTVWGKPTEDKFKVVDDREFEKLFEKSKCVPASQVNLDGIKAIYRNLRENYEYRLRYDEAGEFFIREMELKRNYHQDSTGNTTRTDPLRRRFSLTGLYYHLFKYGESLRRPALTVILPFLGLSVLIIYIEHDTSLIKAIERMLSDILQIQLNDSGLTDSFIRVLSLGILGMYLIPLRRRFERKFRH